MRSLYIICVFQLLLHQLRGQGSSGQAAPAYSYSIAYAPAIGFRALRFEDDHQSLKRQRNQQETPAYGFHLSAGVQRRFGRSGSVELGVSFSSMGYRTKRTMLIWQPTNPAYPSSAFANFQFQYLGLAGKYKYWLGNAKSPYYLLSGIAADAFLQRKSRLTILFPDGGIDRSTSSSRGGFAQSSISLMAGVGIRLPLSHRYAICLEPFYRRGLTSIIPKNKNKEYLYDFGINTQFLFHLP